MKVIDSQNALIKHRMELFNLTRNISKAIFKKLQKVVPSWKTEKISNKILNSKAYTYYFYSSFFNKDFLNRKEIIYNRLSNKNYDYFTPYFLKDPVLLSNPLDKMRACHFVNYILDSMIDKRELVFPLSWFIKDDVNEILRYFLNNLLLATPFDLYYQELFDLKEFIRSSKIVFEFIKNCKISSSITKIYQEETKKIVEFVTKKITVKDYTIFNYESIENFYKSPFIDEFGISQLFDIEKDYIKKRIREGIIIDGGSGIGESTLILNKFKPKKIVCFEPNLILFKLLKINTEIISKKIDLKNLALYDEAGFALQLTQLGNNSYITLEKENLGFISTKNVFTTTIDKYSEINNEKIDLIKLDLNGSESKALEGASEVIKKHKPILIISIQNNPDNFWKIPWIIKNINSDYRLRFINTGNLRTEIISGRNLIAYCPDI